MKGPYHVVHESYDSYVSRKLNDPTKLMVFIGLMMAIIGLSLGVNELIKDKQWKDNYKPPQIPGVPENYEYEIPPRPTGPLNLSDTYWGIGGAGLLLFILGIWLWRKGK